jgi:hypothetical protein
MHHNVRVEADDLIEYAAKKYDVEEDEAEAWCDWILPENPGLHTIVLHELLPKTPEHLSTTADHPLWRGHQMLIDYMSDLEFYQITVVKLAIT